MGTGDLLFELGTEELPPRMLPVLSAALADGMVRGLHDAGIVHGRVDRFATPRRLAVRIADCARAAPGRQFERRGPPVSAAFDAAGEPTQAALAFARNQGVPVAELARLTTDKGQWLVHRGRESGANTAEVIGSIIEQSMAALPIPKRMRWGAGSAEFVRPVHTVLLLFDGAVVPLRLFGLDAGRLTLGHRFHAPRPVAVDSAREYAERLREAHVIADFGERRELIRSSVQAAAAACGGTALLDDALLDEVTALVEWPVPVAGRFETRFLALPREVVIATVQEHQRYFPVEDAAGRLTGDFVTVSNIESRAPDAVRQGNERVVRPRLSDAAFFWDQDRKLSLDEHARRLGGVVFQTRLGSYADKTARVASLANLIGRRIDAGPHVDRAARLAKADLMTSMVGEFPELQGIMGRYYAAAQGEPEDVSTAIEEHYRPRFAGDALPGSRTGQALALADKIDTLVGIFAIEQRPTGTKDPFGLRRAALGVLRILLEGGLDIDLADLLRESAAAQPVSRAAAAAEVHDFMAERLRGLLLERGGGISAEMIDAVFAGRPASPLDAAARLDGLKDFLAMPDSAVLTGLNKRIVNILRKSPPDDAGVRVELLVEPAERELQRMAAQLQAPIGRALEARRYGEALRLSMDLSAPVDDFFERIMVMDEDAERRRNRLALLREVGSLLSGAADLSRLPG